MFGDALHFVILTCEQFGEKLSHKKILDNIIEK
jgi:hypothetical protein